MNPTVTLFVGIFGTILLLLLVRLLLSRRHSKVHTTSRQQIPTASRFPLPFLGQLTLLMTSCPVHEIFQRWSKEIGPIFSVQLGQYKVVVINGHAQIKKAMSDSRFNGRPLVSIFSVISDGHKGILSGVDSAWDQIRSFTNLHLKNFGMGKKSLDSIMHSEISDLLLSIPVGESSNSESEIFKCVTNFMWMVLAGERPDNRSRLHNLVLHTARSISHFSSSAIGFVMPTVASKILPRYSGWDEVSRNLDALRGSLSELITDRECLLDGACSAQTLSDSLILDLNRSGLGKDHAVATMMDLFFGGSLKIASTLQWAILYLAADQRAQAELIKEIDSVVGANALPAIKARPLMPYNIAVLMETLRKSSFYPLGLFRQTIEDANLCGFDIPKGATVWTNLWSAHHDPDVWEDPQIFRPERFIREEGGGKRRLERHEASLPFSFGDRSCLGELLAKEFLFLALTSLFQRFTVKLCQPIGGVLMETRGIFNIPEPCAVEFSER